MHTPLLLFSLAHTYTLTSDSSDGALTSEKSYEINLHETDDEPSDDELETVSSPTTQTRGGAANTRGGANTSSVSQPTSSTPPLSASRASSSSSAASSVSSSASGSTSVLKSDRFEVTREVQRLDTCKRQSAYCVSITLLSDDIAIVCR